MSFHVLPLLVTLLLAACSKNKLPNYSLSNPNGYSDRFYLGLHDASMQRQLKKPVIWEERTQINSHSLTIIQVEGDNFSDFWVYKICQIDGKKNCKLIETSNYLIFLDEFEEGYYEIAVQSCQRSRLKEEVLGCSEYAFLKLRIDNELSSSEKSLVQAYKKNQDEFQKLAIASNEIARNLALSSEEMDQETKQVSYNLALFGSDYWTRVYSDSLYLDSIVFKLLESDNNEQLQLVENNGEEKKEDREVDRKAINLGGSLLISLGSPLFVLGASVYSFGQTIGKNVKTLDKASDQGKKKVTEAANSYLGTHELRYYHSHWDEWFGINKSIIIELKDQKILKPQIANSLLNEMTDVRGMSDLLSDGTPINEELRTKRRSFDKKMLELLSNARQEKIRAYNEHLAEQSPLLDKVREIRNALRNEKSSQRIASLTKEKNEILEKLKPIGQNIASDIESVSDISKKITDINRLSYNPKMLGDTGDLGRISKGFEDEAVWIVNNLRFMLGEVLVHDVSNVFDKKMHVMLGELDHLIASNEHSSAVRWLLSGKAHSYSEEIGGMLEEKKYLLQAHSRQKLADQLTDLQNNMQITINRLTMELREQIRSGEASWDSNKKQYTQIMNDGAFSVKKAGLLLGGIGVLMIGAGIAIKAASDLKLAETENYALQRFRELDGEFLALKKQQLLIKNQLGQLINR